MSLITLNPMRHAVVETAASRLFRDRLKEPSIFTYFNRDTGQWVLAHWLNKMTYLADEIDDLGPAFEAINDEFVQNIQRFWGPIDWQKKKLIMNRKHAERERRKIEEIQQEGERYRWLQKRLNQPIPYAIDSGSSK